MKRTKRCWRVEKSSNTKHSISVDIKTAAALVAANFFFGTNIIAVKYISPVLIGPLGLSFARMFFSALLLVAIPFVTKEKEKIKSKDYPLLILAGMLGITCNQICSIVGIAYTNPIHASLLNMATPIFVSVLAAVFLKEQFGWNKYLGLTLGVMGAAMLISTRSHAASTNPATLKGDAFIVLGSICYSTYLILIRNISARYNALTVLRFVFIFGTLFSLPVCFSEFYHAQWNEFSLGDWYAIFHIVILGTFLSYLMMNMGVTKWGPSRTGSFVYFQPLFGTLAAVVFLGEALNGLKALAGILIIAGVWINAKRLKRQKATTK